MSEAPKPVIARRFAFICPFISTSTFIQCFPIPSIVPLYSSEVRVFLDSAVSSANPSVMTSIETFLTVCVVLISLACGWLVFQTLAIRNRWRELLDGARGQDIERLMYEHLRERMALQEDVRLLTQRVSDLESKMLRSKRFVGVVRYDAFEDVGGSQSFALAVYDDKGDGAIITSLVGRADCRVYCKPLEAFKSDRSLSKEEQEAIRQAKDLERLNV